MTISTAFYIIKKAGLYDYSLAELRGLLDDRYDPLPGAVREAIKTILEGGV